MQQLDRRPLYSVRDAVFIAGLLALINLLMARSDPGWINLNPTPWLLLPALIGGRYGVTPGLISGLLAAAGIALLQARAAGEEAPVFARQHPFFFTSLALCGFLMGEMNRLGRARARDLQETSQRLTDEASRMAAELELARETKHELQRHLALLNAPIASLDSDLRKLMTDPPAQLMGGLLDVLHRHVGISSAAMYQLDETGTSLRRLAVMHPSQALAEVLPLETARLAEQALHSGIMASLADPFQTSAAQPFLIAAPWEGTGRSGVLLVRDMPLQSYDGPGLARIELILQWVFTLDRHRTGLGTGEGRAEMVGEAEFKTLLARTLEAERVHHLPSVVVKVSLAADARGSKAERQFLAWLPPTASCTRLPDGSLAVLLLFSGETEALALGQDLAKAGPPARVAHYLVMGAATPEDFWAHLILP